MGRLIYKISGYNCIKKHHFIYNFHSNLTTINQLYIYICQACDCHVKEEDTNKHDRVMSSKQVVDNIG